VKVDDISEDSDHLNQMDEDPSDGENNQIDERITVEDLSVDLKHSKADRADCPFDKT
jgi:hypothetical protein